VPKLSPRSLRRSAGALLTTLAITAGGLVGAQSAEAAVVLGMDVSSYQGNVAWSTAYANGARFAYVKATEGTGYTNPYFTQQYNGSYNAGMIRGAYHFALPNSSGGATQADYFVAHGGGWSADGKTLPGALDIEYNPYSGGTCYGLSQSSMVSWIRAFSNEYHAKTGRYPVIYSTTDWWTSCTGNNSGFASTSPLWIARYASSAGTLPAGWGYYTFWQNADSGTFPGDQDRFNGAYSQLQAIATG
jgi:GH25 family lysozyme M1 (1,4-beta-N-acetylmuramidase)